MEHKQELGHKEPTPDEIKKMAMEQAHHDIHHHSSLARKSSKLLSEQNAAPTITTATTEDEQEVSFFHDFIAGGVAGSASVVVGHPMDTLKVRMQTAKGNPSIMSLAIGSKYGGPATLFRGMGAPLSAACAVNALIFSSYGWSTRLYDQYPTDEYINSHVKAFTCGSFAGLVQALVICPMEHVKCRLQIQETASSAAASPSLRTTLRGILTSGGRSANIPALYRGWWITCWREIPAFGAYFALYDIFKDSIQETLDQRNVKETSTSTTSMAVENQEETAINSNPTTLATTVAEPDHNAAHTWFASAIAGGLTGALSWAMVYPFDVIKTQIQTAPIDTPQQKRRISYVVSKIVKEHGWQKLFRGLTVTCLRAFPVNGIVFPVYEYTLLYVCAWET